MPPKKTTKKQDAERIADLERQLQMTRLANGKLNSLTLLTLITCTIIQRNSRKLPLRKSDRRKIQRSQNLMARQVVGQAIGSKWPWD